MVGTIMSMFILNLWPLDVSTNNSSDTFGDRYVWSSDRKSRIIIAAPVTVTAKENNHIFSEKARIMLMVTCF